MVKACAARGHPVDRESQKENSRQNASGNDPSNHFNEGYMIQEEHRRPFTEHPEVIKPQSRQLPESITEPTSYTARLLLFSSCLPRFCVCRPPQSVSLSIGYPSKKVVHGFRGWGTVSGL
jgi:hypothetical protein